MMPKRAWSTSLRDKVDALKQAVDLRDLFLERYPDRFRRSGRWLYGSSPYRHDEHPSFAVNEDVYIDFATGEHGDEVDFIMREQGLSFAAALAVLETHAGGTPILPAQGAAISSYSASTSEPPPAEWQQVMRAECRAAHAYLFSNAKEAKAAYRWLRDRGLSRETLRHAGIGYNAAWRPTRLRDSETGKAISIAPGIVIPCFVDGALWSVHVRTLPPSDLPKYLYVRGSKSSVLYNGDALTPSSTVLLVEGEFDALLAQQELGAHVVVVTLGSAANRLPRRWFDRLVQAGRIYSCFDQDEAGQRATAQIAAQFPEQHQPLHLPQGKDITEFVLQYRGDLRKWWRIETAGNLAQAVQLKLW